MTPDAGKDDPCIESEFATTVKYLDLYIRQKTDLFLQNYVFEPFDALGTKFMFLAVIVTLLVTGTLVLLAGVILLLATRMPLFAAFLIVGVAMLLSGAVITRVFFFKKIVLKTPTATEMMNCGKE